MAFSRPIVIPEKKAAIGRNIANNGPIKEYVAAIESKPVAGVPTKNERVALRLAPYFLKDAATGMTPHEHSGNGIPKMVAFKIDANRPLPR